jgi:hypothetical protein
MAGGVDAVVQVTASLNFFLRQNKLECLSLISSSSQYVFQSRLVHCGLLENIGTFKCQNRLQVIELFHLRNCQ